MPTRATTIAAATALLVVGTAGASLAVTTGVTPDKDVDRFRESGIEAAHGASGGAEEVGTAVLRLSGADRYETSAAVSRAEWDPEEVSVVHLVTGEGYADALSMGASTRQLGPVLLTQRDRLPAPIVTELERLTPCLVVVVGGPGAVSDAVALEADRYTDPAACEA